MTIIETTLWIDYIAGADNAHTRWLDQELDRQRFGLTDLILCEVLQGVRDDRLLKQVQRDLLRFAVFDSGGKSLAIASAQNYRYLRARGFTIRKTIDCEIATFCINAGYSLLHRDRDFDPFEQYLGLQVEHPEKLV